MSEAWMQILVILGTNMAMFMWARSEARHDQQELREIMRIAQEELKHMHGRICGLEKGRK